MTPKSQSSHFEALRQKAESLIASALDLTQGEEVQDIKELLHQLQVYQIELELQNEELVSTRAELEASRDTYFKLFDFAPIGYFLFDREGLLRESNLFGASLLGVERNYLTNKPFMLYVDSEHQQTFYSHRRRAFSERLPQFCEFKLVSRTGEAHYIHMHSIVIKDREEELCLSAVVDVTEQKRVEQAMKEAKAEAEKASQAKSDFLARMSHEIRTPLHGILGMTDVAIKTLDKPGVSELTPHTVSEVTSLLRMSRQSAFSLLNIINDILDIAKVETGILILEEKPFALRDLIAEALSPFVFEAKQKGVALTSSLDDHLPDQVLGDPTRLRQVLVNLMGNAIKFTKQGRVNVRVRCANCADAATALKDSDSGFAQRHSAGRIQLMFTIEDTGVGIPEEKLPYVFENFYQADDSFSREYEGAGLGLAICKHLVKMMGGKIWVESRLGHGSVFTFTVWLTDLSEARPAAVEESPATERSDAPALQAPSAPPPGAASQDAPPALPPLSILLAEDNLVNQAFAQLILKREGHKVSTAPNGLQALRALAESPFDLVLMDVRMPELDGVEASRRIRSGEAGVLDPDIPIIAMTAHSQKGDRERFLEAGMDDYISKPMTWESVIEIIGKVLERKGRLERG